jgi:3-oxoacyl-[acyl-carrier-protein] synthase II
MSRLYKAGRNGNRRVVVTGLGLICGSGNNAARVWTNVVAGRSAVGRITHFDASSFACKIAAEVKGFDPLNFVDKAVLHRTARFVHLAMAATHEAVSMSGLKVIRENEARVGVCIGSGCGGCELFEREHRAFMNAGPGQISSSFFPGAMVNAASELTSVRYGAKGPNETISTGCASGAHAIGHAFRIIQRYDADMMIAGGTEAPITPLVMAGFAAMRALSTRNDEPEKASRPWDRNRDGFVIGEGAGILILETLESAIRRDATILAEIIGYGSGADAYHITLPEKESNGVCKVMLRAMADAGVSRHEIDYVNAHATSTPAGDALENQAIKLAFSNDMRAAISSTKSMTGHLLGAAGALEAGITILATRHQIAPPTINLVDADDGCDLDYIPHQARKTSINISFSNSFGYGGTNASLVFRRWQADGDIL